MTPPHIMIIVTKENDSMKIAHLWCVLQENVLYMYRLFEPSQISAAIHRVKPHLLRQNSVDGVVPRKGS
jgi:hypothetical protein